MAAVLLLGLGWFLGGLVVYLLARRAGWWSVVFVLFWLACWFGSDDKGREPSIPRPVGDTMEDRYRQKEWDEMRDGLN